jgi:hypothetical protein
VILEDIQLSIVSGKFRFSDHAKTESENDKLAISEIIASVNKAEIIEYYPNDFPFPSCLVLSFTLSKEPVHSVWGYNEENKSSVLITVYRPDPRKWKNLRERIR